jgi:ribonucleoside-diphosphate reductase beta chain
MSFTPIPQTSRSVRRASAGLEGAPASLGRGGRDAHVARLYDKARRLGTWDPADIDFGRDAADWGRLTVVEHSLLLRVACLFLDGEEAVTRDLLPLGHVLTDEGRLDDQLFLTAWLWEEGKHTYFFHRFQRAVLAGEELSRSGTLASRQILGEELPAVMGALLVDPSPAAQTRALVTYCLIVEGVLAEAAHRVFREVLDRRDLMPGLRHGLALVRRDESRHVAYGMHVLSRLQRADPANRRVARERADELIPVAISLLGPGMILGYPGALPGVQSLLDKPLERLHRRLDRIEQTGT